jgi:hypothetical protein
MSFLARIAARAMADPAQPVLTPKDRGVPRASPLAPEAQDGQLAPMRASRTPALRRAAAPMERDEDEVAAPLRRWEMTPERDAQAARAAVTSIGAEKPEDEVAAPLRRSGMIPEQNPQAARAAVPAIGAEKPEDEVAAPLRRSGMIPEQNPQAARAAVPAIGEETPEEEIASPLRRSQMMPEQDTQAARAAVPAVGPENPEEEVAAPLRRAAQSLEDTEEAPIAARTTASEEEGEPEGQIRRAVLRRANAPMEEDDDVAPMRRVADLGQDKEAAVRTARALPPDELLPATSLPLNKTAGEASPPNPPALRRAATGAIAAPRTQAGVGMPADASHESSATDRFLVASEAPASQSEPSAPQHDRPETAGFTMDLPAAPVAMRPVQRPKVVIDRVDVLIQQPTPPARETPTRDIARSLRARYLGRL